MAIAVKLLTKSYSVETRASILLRLNRFLSQNVTKFFLASVIIFTFKAAQIISGLSWRGVSRSKITALGAVF